MVGPEGYDPFWDDVFHRGRAHYFDRQTNPISFRRWVELHGGLGPEELKVVKQETVGDLLFVSTVFLGIDMSWFGPPMIFETMVFAAPLDDEPRLMDVEDLEQTRYSTEAEAEAGHREMVRRAKEWLAANAVTEETLRRLLEAE
jgi:hypothetical protein